jgi:hypothetical protein
MRDNLFFIFGAYRFGRLSRTTEKRSYGLKDEAACAALVLLAGVILDLAGLRILRSCWPV